MNVTAYIIYLPISGYITIVVGNRLHADGIWYIKDHFPGQDEFATIINRFLLIGYYLINLGYVAISIINWETILTFLQMAEVLSFRIGIIILGLGIMHYINMGLLSFFSPNKITNPKNQQS